MEISREAKKYWWVKYVSTVLVAVIFVTLSVWKQGAFAMVGKPLLEAFSNALVLTGLIMEFFVLPLLIKYGNLFEKLLQSLIKSIARLRREDSVDRKYRNFHRHRRLTQEKERTLRIWLWYANGVGVSLIVIGGLLLLAYTVV